MHFSAEHFVASVYGRRKLRLSRADDARHTEHFSRIHVEIYIGKTVTAKIFQGKHEFALCRSGRNIFDMHFARTVRRKSFEQHIVGKILYVAVHRNRTVDQKRDAVRNDKHFVEPVRDIDDADLFFLQLFDDFKKRIHFVERERRRRFVEKHNARGSHETAENFDELLFRNGKRARSAVEIEFPAELRNDFGEAFVQFAFIAGDSHDDVFFERHIRKKHRLLRDEVNTRSERSRRISEVQRFSVNEYFARIGLFNAHNRLYERAFSRTVSPDKRKHVAGIHVQVDAFEHGVGTERFIDFPYRKHRKSLSVHNSFPLSNHFKLELLFYPKTFSVRSV